MEDKFINITEETAQRLCDAFSNFTEYEPSEFLQEIEKCMMDTLDNMVSLKKGLCLIYYARMKMSPFLTRWYWKSKYKKERIAFHKVIKARDILK